MAGYRTLPGTDEIAWNGRRYRRHPNSKHWAHRTYYMATTAPRTYLHRDVYEAAHGPIPDGFHVHHLNHNPADNRPENLALLSAVAHAAHHAAEHTGTPRNCDECGREYLAERDWSRWCSPACKERRRRADGVAYQRPRTPFREARKCDECGADYEAKKPWARFCSGACRGRAGRRSRGGLEP